MEKSEIENQKIEDQKNMQSILVRICEITDSPSYILPKVFILPWIEQFYFANLNSYLIF